MFLLRSLKGCRFIWTSKNIGLNSVGRLHRRLHVEKGGNEGGILFVPRPRFHWLLLFCQTAFPYSSLHCESFFSYLDSQPVTKVLTSSAADEICGISGGDKHEEYLRGTKLHALVRAQKDRAKKRWEESYAKSYFSKTIHDHVLALLNKGKVPPIFHTLCREPLKRLFSPNTLVSVNEDDSDSEYSDLSDFKGKLTSEVKGTENNNFERIEISTDFVDAGKSSTLDESTNESIWDDDNFSYLDAFFASDGNALKNVKDNVLKNDWVFKESLTKIVTDLVNTPADMVGYDVEVTKLRSVFPVDRKNGKNLITRSLSRGVVADCFEHSEADSVYAIVGSPGIGKSWNLVYALQQALLYENACVLFCFQKRELAWVCIRKKHNIFVWTLESFMLGNKCVSGLFKNGNVLVLLDPGESNLTGASFAEGNRRLIYAASNNSRHFSSLLSKGTAFAKRFLDPFTENELRVSIPFMIKANRGTDYCIEERIGWAKIVGSLVRYIIDEKKFEERKQHQQESIAQVKNNESVDLESIFNWNGMSDDRSSIPDTLFVVTAEKPASDEAFAFDVGYDGERVTTYEKKQISFISPEIKMEIISQWRARILTYFGKVTSADMSKMGELVEDLFWEDLKKGVIMRCFAYTSPMPHFNTRTGEFIGQTPKSATKKIVSAPTIYKDLLIQDLPGKVFGAKEGAVCRMKRTCVLIDFADSKINVYQATTKGDHDTNFNGMEELLSAAGFLQKSKEGDITLNEKIGQKKLNFFWVVPSAIEGKWKRKIKKDPPDSTSKIVKACYQKHVDVFVLLMENEPTYVT